MWRIELQNTATGFVATGEGDTRWQALVSALDAARASELVKGPAGYGWWLDGYEHCALSIGDAERYVWQTDGALVKLERAQAAA